MRKYIRAFVTLWKRPADEAPTNPIRIFFRDWPWKLVALGVACIVFYGVRRSVSYTQTLTLTVEAEMSEDGGQALTGFEPSVVAVTFRGSEDAIRQLSLPGAEPPRIRLRFQQPPAGTTQMTLPIARRDVTCSSGLRVTSISPGDVKAFFDSSDTRALPVATPLITNAPSDATIHVTIEPRTVEVTGSRVRLEELLADQIQLDTTPLDLTSRNEDFQTVLRVSPPDSRGGWTLRPDTVRADVHFIREEIERDFPEVPVHVLQSPSGTRYQPEVPIVSLSVAGPRNDVETIDPSAVMVLAEEPLGTPFGSTNRISSLPTVVLPCTNRVTRVTVRPTRVTLIPVDLDLEHSAISPSASSDSGRKANE